MQTNFTSKIATRTFKNRKKSPAGVGRNYPDIIRGLMAEQKYINSKYFYDSNGSVLFEEICRLPEYYPTRTEISILEQIAPEIMSKYKYSEIIELGSGEALKIKVLLDAISPVRQHLPSYIPVDISKKAIDEISVKLKADHPKLKIRGMVRDFMKNSLNLEKSERRLFCFFGSTIGNLNETDSILFLKNISAQMSENDHFLLGFDNVKSKETLERAYNDSQGVTAAFNKNILRVVNHKAGATFNPDLFHHHAFYNEDAFRIEMHLIATTDMHVWMEEAQTEIYLKAGERIHTENSRKYTLDMIRSMADRSGLRIRRWHTDPMEWFTVAELKRS